MTPGPTPDHAVIEFVHARRVVLGGVLLALAVACLAVAGFCGYRGLKDNLDKPDKPADTPAEVKPADPTADAVELDTKPYLMGMAQALLASLGLGGVGAFFVGRVPDPDAAVRRRTDRILLLVGGYVFGLANRVCGLFLFLHWFDKLGKWVDGDPGSHKTGWWPVAALLQFLVGAGITFLAALPARAEERNRPWVRRAVYAVNFALSGLLLVVGLVLVNAVVVMKLPDKLDTTSTGFYTLTDETTKYLTGLKQPIKVYLLTTETSGLRVQEDAVRLLARCRQVNPARVEVVTLSPSVNGDRIRELQQQYKSAELREPGVLLTTPDGERFEMLPLREMVTSSRGGKENFVGEAQLVGRMMALTEGRTTVYFTRGAGELTLTRPDDPSAALGRPAFRLQDAFRTTQCEARPLVINSFDTDAKVPDDAGMVVVLDPLNTLSPATVSAIQRYMTTPRADKKRGKLLVFAGAHNVPAGNSVAKTGLEPVLAELGVDLVDRAIYNEPVAENAPPDVVIVGVSDAAVRQRNPMAVAAQRGLLASGARPVRPSPAARGPAAQPFMGVASKGYTWVEKGVIDPPQKALRDMIAAGQRRDAAYQQERQVSNEVTIPVGMTVTDAEGKPVAAVFGFADALSDDGSAADGGRAAAVFKASLGWLRERPPAPDISPKEYAEYTPKKGVSEYAILQVPVFGTLLAVVALGLAVWAVRRK